MRPDRRRTRLAPRGAATLVELLVAAALALIVVGALYVVRFRTPDSGFTTTGRESSLALDLQGQLHRIVTDVQEATQLFYPLPGKGQHAGLGLVNPRGETILYYATDASDGTGRALVRVNVNAHLARREKASESYVRDLRYFGVSVAPAEPGKEPSLATVELAQEQPGADPGRPRVVHLVTSAYVRHFERRVPDDLFPAGTPLVDLE